MTVKRLATTLRAIAYAILDALLTLADRLDPAPDRRRSDRELRAEAHVVISTAHLRRDHPCPQCDGKGYLVVSAGTDTALCPNCKGLHVDPLRLIMP